MIGQNGGIGVPLPDEGDVPDGFNVHLHEFNMTANEVVGISLVPSSRELEGYFQVFLLNPSICFSFEITFLNVPFSNLLA